MVFRTILWWIGALLATASRLHPRLRAQIARDMIVTVQSREGIARSFVFHDRRVSSYAGTSPHANLVVTFPNAAIGARILVARDAVLQIVRGLSAKEIEVTGAPTHLLWFYEMVTGYLPWRRPRYHIAPNAYTAPDPNGKVADRITREPPEAALDPACTDAVAQREKLELWRVAKGELSLGRVPGFKYVVDIPDVATRRSS